MPGEYHQLRPEENQNDGLQLLNMCKWFFAITIFLIGSSMLLVRTFAYTELTEFQLYFTLRLGVLLTISGFCLICYLRKEIVVQDLIRRLSESDIEEAEQESQRRVRTRSQGLYSLPNREQQPWSPPRRSGRRHKRRSR